MKPPCEVITMHVLPAVRASLARTLVGRHGMRRTDVARRLGVTQAAVTQYFKEERGNRNRELIDGHFPDLIEEMASRIAREEDGFGDICSLCKRIRKDPGFERFLARGSCGLCEG